MIGMATPEMNIFSFSGERETTSGTISWSSEAVKLLFKIFLFEPPQTVVDEILGKVKNIDGMWQIA